MSLADFSFGASLLCSYSFPMAPSHVFALLPLKRAFRDQHCCTKTLITANYKGHFRVQALVGTLLVSMVISQLPIFLTAQTQTDKLMAFYIYSTCTLIFSCSLIKKLKENVKLIVTVHSL